MNRGGQISLCDLAFNSFGYISGSGIAGSYGNSIFNFLRNYHNSYAILHFYQQYEFQFLYIFTNTCYSTKKIVILTGLRWYLTIVLICMISDDDHLFMCLLAVFMSSWRNVCSNPLPILELGFGWLSFKSFLYVLVINPLSDA